MMEFFDIFRDNGEISTLSIILRLVLAVICGGAIGIEREHKRRPAGFRTHILISLGAAMTTLTSQYIVLNLNHTTDPARLGAQVIAGIGFIGAGTIIVTQRRQVKGLTTAAGLWASAIVGLCCGAAFFEGAIVATVLILMAEIVFSKIEYFIISSARTFSIIVEYQENSTLGKIVDNIKKSGAHIHDMEITKSHKENRDLCAVFSLQIPRKMSHQALMTMISKTDNVTSVEEL